MIECDNCGEQIKRRFDAITLVKVGFDYHSEEFQVCSRVCADALGKWRPMKVVIE